jgi:transposase
MLKLNSKTKLDLSQPIYMGIDVHKKKYFISLVHCNQFIRRVTIDGTETALTKFIKPYSKYKINSVYEAGFCGFHLHYILIKLGVNNIITPPNKLPIISGDKVKTDKRDSLKLATFLAKDLLKAINIPTHEILNFRQALRTREQLSRKRKRCINQIKGALLLQGIAIETTGLTLKSIKYISDLDLPDIIKALLMIHIDTYKFVSKQMKEIELRAKESISSQQQNYDILKSIPGVGPII